MLFIVKNKKKFIKIIILSILLLLDVIFIKHLRADVIQDLYNANSNFTSESTINNLKSTTPNYDENCTDYQCTQNQEYADKFLDYGTTLTDTCTVNVYDETKTLVCDNRTEIVCEVHSANGSVYGVETCDAWYGITKVVGDGNQLKFYINSTYLGAITVDGCSFSGSAFYYTCSGDSCSSTSWGLSGVSANGSQLIFYGGNCGQEVGRINLGGGCKFQATGGAGGLDLTRVKVENDTLYFYRGRSGDSLIMSVKLCTDREHTYTTCNYVINRIPVTP